MKKYIFVCIIIVVVVVIAALSWKNFQPKEAIDSAPIVIKTGSYLSEAYLKALDETRSPNKSLEGTNPQLIFIKQVEKQKQTLSLQFIINFYEGSDTYDLKLSGRSYKDKDGQVTLTPLADEKFIFQSKIESYPVSEIVYVRVPDEEEYVTSKTIAGNYQDENGSKYSFRSNNRANIDGKEVEYRITLNMWFGYDTICIEKTCYPFTISEDGIVTVYDEDASEEGPDLDKITTNPKWVLKKI